MSRESNPSLVHEGLSHSHRMQQQQAQFLFRQRQLQQQQQQRTLPPTPTLSSQGSPAFGQVAQAQSQIPLPNKSIITPTATTTTQRAPSMGQAVLRLLQFRDQLSPGDQAKDVSFWRGFVDDFFTTNAIMKFTLLDNTTLLTNEFEITQSLIARFFHTHYQCELESIQLTTDQTMEYFLPTGMMLECPRSSVIHRYNNGTLVILSGELSVLFNMDPNDGILKIHQWKFSCNQHDEYIARSKLVPVDANAASKKKLKSPKTPTFHTPHSLVNNWGLPQRIYELLRIIDTSTRLGEVAFFSLVTGQTPNDALTAMSFAIHQKMTGSYPEEAQDISPLLTTDILNLLPPVDSPFILPSTTPTPTPTPTIPPSMNSPTISSPLNISSNLPSNMVSHMTQTPSHNIPNNMAQHPTIPLNFPQTPNISTPNMNTPNMSTPNISTPNMSTPNMNSHTTPIMNTPNMNPKTTPIISTHNMNAPTMNTSTMNTSNMTTPNIYTPNMTPNMTAPNMTSIMNASNMDTANMSTPLMHVSPLSNMDPQSLAQNMVSQPLHAQVISNMNLQPQGMHSQSTQFMQQAALQRYYQQQNIRMQHQQQALQMQQRQAMQRLQQPFTKDILQTPPIDDKLRKRKMSIPKDVKKPTAVKKAKK